MQRWLILQEQQMGTGIYTPINRSNNTMSNGLYTNRTNYNDLIERVENLEKQHEINKKKELVRVFWLGKKS